jgi:hypothetical protein
LAAHLRDPKRPAEEKAAGYIALETTSTLPTQVLQTLLGEATHPVTRLHAARCLVCAGERTAVQQLIALLECEQTPEADDEAVDCAREGAHEVLVELAGKDFGESSKSWLPWYRDLGPLKPRKLESSPPAAW